MKNFNGTKLELFKNMDALDFEDGVNTFSENHDIIDIIYHTEKGYDGYIVHVAYITYKV